MNDTPLPVLFVGHGNPMNALERNRYTEAWAGLGEPSRGREPSCASRPTGTRTPLR